MFRIGIICKDEAQVTEITELMCHKAAPRRRTKGFTEFISDLLQLVIITQRQMRGYRFDLCFYNEEIDDELFQTVVRPSCRGCARPLEELKWRL